MHHQLSALRRPGRPVRLLLGAAAMTVAVVSAPAPSSGQVPTPHFVATATSGWAGQTIGVASGPAAGDKCRREAGGSEPFVVASLVSGSGDEEEAVSDIDLPLNGDGSWSGQFQIPPEEDAPVGPGYQLTASCYANEDDETPLELASVPFIVLAFPVPACTANLTGDVAGPLVVAAGQTVCIGDARVAGPITVNPGGGLAIAGSQVTNGIVADGPTFFSVCATRVAPPPTNRLQGVVVANATGPVRIGDPDTGCGTNLVSGAVGVSASSGGVTVGANVVSGGVTLNGNLRGPNVVKANKVFGALSCAGNSPPPGNADLPNEAAAKAGQCAAL